MPLLGYWPPLLLLRALVPTRSFVRYETERCRFVFETGTTARPHFAVLGVGSPADLDCFGSARLAGYLDVGDLHALSDARQRGGGAAVLAIYIPL